jgi:hypothetical protein
VTAEPTHEAPQPSPTPVIEGRYGTFSGVATGADLSLQLRWAQTRAAWNIFATWPVTGGGPGVIIPWINWDGELVAESWADTPVTILAKFGIFGLVIWGALGWAVLKTLRRLRRGNEASLTARSALLGFATGLVVLTPLGPQLEDKGTALAMIMLLGTVFAAMRTSVPEAYAEPDVAP